MEKLTSRGLRVSGDVAVQRKTIRDYLNANYLTGAAVDALFSNTGLKFENLFSALDVRGRNHALRAYINAGAPDPAVPNVNLDLLPVPPVEPVVPIAPIDPAPRLILDEVRWPHQKD